MLICFTWYSLGSLWHTTLPIHRLSLLEDSPTLSTPLERHPPYNQRPDLPKPSCPATYRSNSHSLCSIKQTPLAQPPSTYAKRPHSPYSHSSSPPPCHYIPASNVGRVSCWTWDQTGYRNTWYQFWRIHSAWQETTLTPRYLVSTLVREYLLNDRSHKAEDERWNIKQWTKYPSNKEKPRNQQLDP